MQTERNIWLRVLSMILTLALLISCIPNQVYAMAGVALADLLEATDTAVLQPGTTSESTLSTARIVAEDASRRGEFYKEYIMNNGLRYATVYPSAIHYEEGGQWKDIDNTLVAAISGGKAVYQNTAGVWSVRFPQSLSGSDMIGITKDGFTVQFGMAGEMRSSGDLVVASIGQVGATADTLAVSSAQTATAQIQQIDLTAARAAAEHPETILDKLNSRLTYANVYPNTNVVYDLQGNQLKESVILQQYDASLWGYRYTLDTGDLVPVLRDDQQIDLCDPDTNEVVLTMPAPYMLDNNGEISHDVEVTLKQNGSSYLLSYYLPRAWLADTDRAWPVILDPVINGNSHYNNVKDVTVAETQTESSTHGVMQCGYSVTCGAMRIYMQYIQLPVLTAADVIVDATISLNKPMTSAASSNVEIHKVLGAWASTTITWATQPEFESDIAAYIPCWEAGWYTWNITEVVRDWYQDGNYGMMFKVPDSVETESTANTWKQFYSSDFSTSADTMPVLAITYQSVSYNVALSHDSATMYKGDTLTLTADTTPTGQAVTWQSDAPAVASVSDTGLVTALSPGTAIITATILDGITASCEIVVEKTINFNYNTSIKVYKGNEITLTADTEPAGEPIVWSSLNPEIATVENGVVTGVSPGNATIRAALSEKIYALCEVEVLATDVYFDCVCESDCAEDCTCGCPDISIYIEDTVTLTAITVPSGQSVTWESDDPTIATVSQTGMVTGISAGTTKIRAYIDQYTFAECTVTVSSWQVYIEESGIRIATGKTFTLHAETTPGGKQITWSSSDPTIATVTQSGVVTALKAGDVIITARLADGSSATCAIIVQVSASLGTSFLRIEQYTIKQLSLDGLPDNAEITWSSSNTDIVTVSSSGIISGYKAGYAYITADSKYLTEPTSLYIHVSLAEGVYYIGSNNWFMIGSPGYPDSGDNLFTYTRQNVGNSQLYQLWYIKELGCCWYSISPVCDTSLYMGITNNNVSLTSELTVWNISYESNGYVIRTGDSYEYNMQVAAPGSYPGCGIYADSISLGSTLHYWHLENAEGLFVIDAETGTYLIDNAMIPIDVGTTADMDSLGLIILNEGSWGSNLIWSSSDTSVATIDPHTGTISGLKRGQCTITATQTINDNIYERTYTLRVLEVIYVLNFYDTTITPDIVDLIDDSVEFLNEVYISVNLRFEMDGEPLPNPFDPTNNDPCYTGPCEEGFGTNAWLYHHKNIFGIAERFTKSYYEPDHVIVCWSNCAIRTYCEHDLIKNDGTDDCFDHRNVDYLAFVANDRSSASMKFYPVVQFLRFSEELGNDSDPDTPNKKAIFMKLVLAHEIAHTLGLEEIYTDEYKDQTEEEKKAHNESKSCLMAKWSLSMYGLFDSAADKSTLLCQYCRDKLEKHIMPKDLFVEGEYD